MNPEAVLTKREKQVGNLLAWGAIKKEVADRLCISIHTVENHVRNIFYKTNCKSVNEFSAWYFCTDFNISMELSPLRNVVAVFLLSIYLSGDALQTIDFCTRTRCRRCAETERVRLRRRCRLNEFEVEF